MTDIARKRKFAEVTKETNEKLKPSNKVDQKKIKKQVNKEE